MTEIHQHNYDLTNWPEGRCTCGDIGMYPPVEPVGYHGYGNDKAMFASLPAESGPTYWCQVCGVHFMTARWAYDHYKSTAELGEVHIIVQLRQDA